jgi:hypothetical protein
MFGSLMATRQRELLKRRSNAVPHKKPPVGQKKRRPVVPLKKKPIVVRLRKPPKEPLKKKPLVNPLKRLLAKLPNKKPLVELLKRKQLVVQKKLADVKNKMQQLVERLKKPVE